jgi:hypothetical protein
MLYYKLKYDILTKIHLVFQDGDLVTGPQSKESQITNEDSKKRQRHELPTGNS